MVLDTVPRALRCLEGSVNAETPIMRAVRAAIARTGRARLLRNNVGYDAATKVRYGLNAGSPDLVGCLRSGRVFCLEVKTPVGRISAEQKAWATAARRWGCFVAFVRSADDALAALERAEKGESE